MEGNMMGEVPVVAITVAMKETTKMEVVEVTPMVVKILVDPTVVAM